VCQAMMWPARAIKGAMARHGNALTRELLAFQGRDVALPSGLGLAAWEELWRRGSGETCARRQGLGFGTCKAVCARVLASQVRGGVAARLLVLVGGAARARLGRCQGKAKACVWVPTHARTHATHTRRGRGSGEQKRRRGYSVRARGLVSQTAAGFREQGRAGRRWLDGARGCSGRRGPAWPQRTYGNAVARPWWG
jgi:hypothetical protein